MKPVAYEKRNGVTYFVYDSKEYKHWEALGRVEGNVGMLLLSRDEKMNNYWGFGTIENPMREPMSMSLMHNPMFDGKRLSDEEIINPPHTEGPITHSYRVIFLDGTDTKPNIKHINGHK